MPNDSKYKFSFRLWDLRYTISCDRQEITKFFKRAYSLFEQNHAKKRGIKEELLIKVPPKDRRPIDEIIVDIQGGIIRSWMRRFNDRIVFFHASSVELDKRYILFAGGERSGKSTMAAIMRDYGVRVLNDDLTPVEYRTGRALNLPIFGNVRKGEWSSLQKRYLYSLRHYIDRYKTIRRNHLGRMSEREFRAYYLYNRNLYQQKVHPKSSPSEKKELVLIFLDRDSNTKRPKLRKVDFPQSFNMFINSLQMAQELFGKKFKTIVQLFGDFQCYSLDCSSPRETARFVISRFR